ncbi:MAG: class I SAM-dependent methyltransferase [Bdellovibrionales bacterium]|nr:class I SAM-dependent methyltransferase [Bdellovibrionales bacterium]
MILKKEDRQSTNKLKWKLISIMSSSIDPQIQAKISMLYERSFQVQQDQPISEIATKNGHLTPQDLRKHFLAISPEQGQYIYELLLRQGCKYVVEFGTSFGISTLYILAAMKVNKGFVVTSELLEEKARVAQKNFNELNLQNLVDLRMGDATITLKENIKPIDFLLLDGWKDLYLPVLQMLLPKLHKGSLVYFDNADMQGVKPALDFVAYSNKFVSKTLHSGKAVIAEMIA